MSKSHVAAVSVIVLVCVIGIAHLRGAAPQTFEMELVKALIHVCIVAVAGAVITLAVFEYQRSRQQEDLDADTRQNVHEYRDELLRQSLVDASTCYAACKRSRRILRARGLVGTAPQTTLHLETYYEHLEKLSDVQLDLERLTQDISNTVRAFPTPDRLLADVRVADEYLSALIKEYEGVRLVKRSSDGEVPLAELPLLEDFLQPSSKGSFLKKVALPLKSIQHTIRQGMLHAKLNAGLRLPETLRHFHE